MRCQIKEKFWSWGDTFHLLDAEENPVFQVRGKAFSWGNNLRFESMEATASRYPQPRRRVGTPRPPFLILACERI